MICEINITNIMVPKMIRLTVRATDESVPRILVKLMQERLCVGVSTQPERHEAPTRQDISDAFGSVMVN
jgi:AP-2 complex subunit alpha